MNSDIVKQQLSFLRMSVAAKELEQVIGGRQTHFDWVSELLEREIDARKERALINRIKRAQFPKVASLEEFDFDFNPDIDKAKILELATLQFLHKKQIALFLGKPGTGKTHLAIAIGIKAVEQGHNVFCSSVKRLAMQIVKAKDRNELDTLFRKILSAKLWILDDWGVVSMKSDVSEEVFDLLDRRVHSNSLILTSNRDVDEWPQVFHEPVIAAAAIDRIFDRAQILTFNGKSYRLNSKIKEIRD
ncbi:MAG: IS21-like element helper ATPase IstB [Bdellovibrionales bacterium]|nr:IS21-like element helper ATPase IstB [Bdellovibrionales bacterium]